MKKDVIKNIIIVVLVLIILAFIVIYLLNPDYSVESTNLTQSAFEAQINLSEYIGKMRAETFDAYTTENIIVGSYNLEDIANSIIMDTTGKEITSLVYSTPDDIITKDETRYYRLNISNFVNVTGVQILNDSNIVWYINNLGILKCKYSHKPDWWVDELEVFHIN